MAMQELNLNEIQMVAGADGMAAEQGGGGGGAGGGAGGGNQAQAGGESASAPFFWDWTSFYNSCIAGGYDFFW